jgi:signal transduction histidine kinase
MSTVVDNSNGLDYQKNTILVVDDNPTNLGVIVDYLKAYGFNLMVARSGTIALKRIEYVHPDIILLDVMMPGIDGFETCSRLKTNEATKDIPVIFMTALASIEDKVKGFELGAVDYVTKPLQQEEVLARVTTHLGLREANRKLVELNATKDKLFSIVAHDLKAPFNPLLGMSELLYRQADTASREEIKETGQCIHRSARGVYNLLDNLLQWAQMQQGRMEYRPVEFELKKVAEQTINLLAENAAGKEINLQSTVAEEAMVYADEYMLDTIIRNLTSNALKFTSKGGQVTISAEPNDSSPGFAEVSVSDTGVGISKEDLDKLFKLEVHYTTEGTAKEKGTGLGLIICQEMIELNGGQVWVESELGQGTSVRFTVPLANGSF